VLPPGEFNGTIPVLLPIYSELHKDSHARNIAKLVIKFFLNGYKVTMVTGNQK